MKKTLIALLVLINLFPPKAAAFGKQGHQIIAELAFQILDPGTRQRLQQYLGNATIGEASTWMDEIKRQSQYNHLKTWHYINIERGRNYQPDSEPNIVNALNKVSRELKEYKKFDPEKVKLNLFILIHLIGDLHQPLHTGYRSDKGGNSVKVVFIKKHTNLHSVWDSDIIQQQKISLNDCRKIYQSLKADQIQKIGIGSFVDWMHQSHAYLPQVYAFQNGMLDQTYANKNAQIVRMQLVTAAIRLSTVLKAILANR